MKVKMPKKDKLVWILNDAAYFYHVTRFFPNTPVLRWFWRKEARWVYPIVSRIWLAELPEWIKRKLYFCY